MLDQQCCGPRHIGYRRVIEEDDITIRAAFPIQIGQRCAFGIAYSRPNHEQAEIPSSFLQKLLSLSKIRDTHDIQAGFGQCSVLFFQG